MKLPEEMPQELKTAIHEQTIKYGKLNFLAELPPIDVIYKLFKDYLDKQPQGINWQPVEELPKKVDKPFIRIVATNSKGVTNLYRYGTSEDLRDYLIESYTHFAEITLPEPPKEITE